MKIFLIIFLSSLTLIFLKTDELSVFKALICANIITRKEQVEDREINSLSPILLTCYIKINDAQVKRLTEGIDKGIESVLSEEEINDLMDIESLKDLSEQDVKKRGEELEEAIKELQKIQEGYSENGEDGYDDVYDDDGDDYDVNDDGPRNNISKKGFFRLIKNGIFNFGNIVLSSWYIICILLVFYLLLLEIRRNNSQETINDKKEKERNDNNDKKNKEDEKEEKDEKKENEDNKEKNKEIENIKDDENKNKDDNKKEKLD